MLCELMNGCKEVFAFNLIDACGFAGRGEDVEDEGVFECGGGVGGF